MALKDSGTRFGSLSIWNHWIVAILMIGMLGFGLYLGDMERSPEKGELIQIHKSIGVFILFYGAWRVLWRLLSRFPDDVADMPAWQTMAAKAVHYALLLGILVMPISGYIMSSAGGHPVGFFGLFELPALAENKELSSMAGEVHEWVGYVLIGIVVVHILAALKHHLMDKDATLARMIGRGA